MTQTLDLGKGGELWSGERPRCTARFERMQPRVWCMLNLDHDGDHWVKDTLYELTWNDRTAIHVAPNL